MTTPIRCLVVDDEPLALQVMQTLLGQLPGVECVATCGSALEALDVLRRHPVDLLFLDIQMPQLTGLELVRSLAHLPKVVFTTAHREYAVDAFDLDVVDYLLKPVSLPRLLRAVDRYRRLAPAGDAPVGLAEEDATITVRADRENVRLRPGDVGLVESVGDYVRVHAGGRVVLVKETMAAFEELLAPHGFLRIHRSYLVPLDRVTSFTGEAVHLGPRTLPIGRTYRQAVLARLQG